ncbi:Hypothetical predicted protein [Mytilus galloprovincialis]|uniref:B box-type domain-containing protein n=1 Tax=Mytilus galloprovincialis TaxID=29158 RepID=A0A8B6CEY5_MYTGA|nr:Hypothetical predicted protein [Mytilus galloprovincialis]
MAHSGSVKRSQDILACGLCETDAKIKVKCMDCDLYMCQKCTEKVHAKFKHADLHDIVALKDIHSHIDANSEFEPVKCKDHRKQLCCMVCLTCELLVCPKCIAKTHRSHLMEEIQTACQQKVEEMKKMQDQVHIKIEKFIGKINLMAEIEKSKSNEIEQKILEEEKQAREVQSKCLWLLKEHKEGAHRHAEQISKQESELLEKEKDIEMVRQHVENMQKSKNAEMFFGAVKSLQTKLESIDQSVSPGSFNIKSQQYVPNYKIQTNSKMVEIEIQFEIKSKYEMNIFSINSITSDKDGNIWIADGCKEIQQLQVKEGLKTLKSHTNFRGYPEIRCLNKSVLLTSFHQICQLAANDESTVFKDLSPNLPYTLHVSDNEIIVGMNCASAYDKVETPIIVRLGFDGEIIQVYKNRGRQLLTRDAVRCCTTINDDDICYIDSNFQRDLKGDVVLINKHGIIQWKYRGNSFINSNEHFFTPVEVLRTKSNNLIISDKKQHALHVVTAKGELMTILDLTLMGLEEPGVMTIDVSGTLWIESKELNKGILSHVIFSGF